LSDDLANINEELVSVACVLDPYGSYDINRIESIFPEICIPFKTHYYIDLQSYKEKNIANNHRRNAKKAKQVIDIRPVKTPQFAVDRWYKLYENLIRRHSINGITCFSYNSFQKQLEVPGAYLYEARYNSITVGMVLFYIQGDYVHYHLAAYNEDGYKYRASFGIFHDAIKHFKSLGLRQLCLGGTSGTKDSSDNGLVRFKKGWASGKRIAWFCGKIIDHRKYRTLVEQKGLQKNTFFPAYRKCL
jgi:lipid II:glycine glycyltransferase (peptidoglycan interpeptide bridge formation enzyme)